MYFQGPMQHFINVHTHNMADNNAIISFYEAFEQSGTVPHCSLGIHPRYTEKTSYAQLEAFAGQGNVLAIGECGLDKLCDTDWSLQETIFRQQIALANKLGKPLIIHCVRAYSECSHLLAAAKVPVIFHGFNRNLRIAQQLLDQGFYLSVGAALFNPAFEPVFTALPVDRLFFETDDRDDLEIDSLYKRAAELKKIGAESLILQVEHNFKKVFNHAR